MSATVGIVGKFMSQDPEPIIVNTKIPGIISIYRLGYSLHCYQVQPYWEEP